jgi:hypothetical protein
MIRILGLDVSKSSVSACLLLEKPEDPRQFYYECPFFQLSADAEGIKNLLALNADIALLEPTGNNYSKLWGWLALKRKSTRYDRLYEQSVGLGITDTVRQHAKRICDLQDEEHAIEGELSELLTDSRFEPYRAVFKKFGFGDRLSSVIISQIYPIEGFLVDGKPEVRIRQGRNSKKPTKRHLSLRRFQKALGAAPHLEASGDSRKAKVVGGSDLCRKSLWQWVFTRIEPKRSRLKNDIGKTLGEQLDAEKAAGRPVKLVRNRIAAKGARLLFRELVKVHQQPDELLE